MPSAGRRSSSPGATTTWRRTSATWCWRGCRTAPAGTRGISLFLVPKFVPDAAGRPGERNGVRALSLEHKLGLHGSPTCVMEYDRARGWLIGEPHQGMAAMFTMMNNARLGVGVEGLSQADAALQEALAFARERRQGRTPGGRADDHRPRRRAPDALDHGRADRHRPRHLPRLRARRSTWRNATGEEDWQARAAFLTPDRQGLRHRRRLRGERASPCRSSAAWATSRRPAIAQFYRDVRVTAIYEGTNGIQAMDMVGRKLADGGAAAQKLIEAVEETARQAAGDLGARLAAAARRLAETTGWMAAAEANDRFAGATPYLRAFALTLGGHYLLRAAAAEGERERSAGGAGGLPHPPAAAAGDGALRRRLRRGGSRSMRATSA